MTLRGLSCGLLIAAATTAGCLAAIEIFLRLVAPQALLRDPDAFVSDPVLGARLAPGFEGRHVTSEFACDWRINAGGYRGPRAGARGEAALRIAAVGDSFTFGYGVEEEQAWPRRLETLLVERRVAGGRVEVLNLGVGGYGTFQETRWLRRVLETEVRPDEAILGFYVGNDPSDNQRVMPAAGGGGPAAITAAPAPRGEPARRWLASRCHTYALLASRGGDLLVRLGLRRLVYPFEMEILREDSPAGIEEAWDATLAALQELAALGRERSVRLLVLVIPMKHQVSDAFWERLLAHYGARGTGGRFDRERPQRVMTDLCRRAGLECLDLLPGLREAARLAGDGGAFHWDRDLHWNARGHAEAARLIADHLGRRSPGG